MVELDVPAMIHVSSSCNPCFHHTGAHYLNGDTTVFMQLLLAPQLFKDFPTLRFIIPHGGGAVPYHWGRYRGLAQDMGLKPLDAGLMNNVYFDTCVYHQPGIDLLTQVVPHRNMLFGTEMIGAVKGIDPETGHHFDDTKRYVDATPHLDDRSRQDLFFNNHSECLSAAEEQNRGLKQSRNVMDLGIAGKKALVCASSRGLGLACATSLAREGCQRLHQRPDPRAAGSCR